MIKLNFTQDNIENGVSVFNIPIQLPIGTFLTIDKEKIFQVTGYTEQKKGEHIFTFPLLHCIKSLKAGEYTFELLITGYSLACITLSDKGYLGQREDISGKTIHQTLAQKLPLSCVANYILPDNPQRLKALVSTLAFERKYDIIITTGGTGISPRDTTPEALLPLLTRRFHAFEQAMTTASLAKTPNALISRAFVGTLDTTLLIALPGSPNAVSENLEAILPALPHALQKLRGSTADCSK